MRDDRERLEDILEAIERIEKYAAKGKDAFDNEELIQVWIIHHVQIIGEAAAQISNESREALPQIPWSDIIAMRNRLIHAYFDINLDILWKTIVEDLPPLISELDKILDS